MLPIPQIRQADPALLAGLREVDPTSEMVYLGLSRAGAKWSLMRLRPKNDQRIRTAQRFLDAMALHWVEPGSEDERRWHMRLRAGLMHAHGYTVVSNWEFQGDPDQRVLQDYRYRAWRLRHDDPYDNPDDERQANADRVRKEFEDPSRARDLERMARNPVTVSKL